MRALLAVAAALLLGSLSCGGCRQSDAERAAAERRAVDEQLKSSLTLLPYRAVKVLTRSKGAPNRPAAWDKLGVALEATSKLSVPVEGSASSALTAEQTRELAMAYGALAIAIVQSKHELDGHDEDEFPFLWTALATTPLPAPWYDNGAEHLGLATAWLMLDIADKKKLPAGDVIFYEASRSTTSAAWPAELRAWGKLLRGVAYCNGEHHYAAEEDLTAYLDEIERAPATMPLVLAQLTLPPEDTQRALRAVGHFARAWNRMGLDRDEAATEDVEAGLQDLDGLGIDNELTQWGWAFVHFQRGRYPESAAQLEKLANSPHFDDATRAELRASAAGLTSNTKVPVLGKARAGVLIGKALFARAGGTDRILEVMLGAQAAPQVQAPLAWLRTSHEQLAQSADPKHLGEAAKALGGSKLDAVKRAIRELTDAGP